MTDLSLREQIAKSVYAGMQWACANNLGDKAPEWAEGGNSFAQDEARKQADAIIERIKGAVPVWQPIETAPKDGTPILTYSGGCDDRNEAYLVMWWTADKAERCGFGWEAYEVDHMLSPDLWIHLEPGADSILAALVVK